MYTHVCVCVCVYTHEADIRIRGVAWVAAEEKVGGEKRSRIWSEEKGREGRKRWRKKKK